MRTVTWRDDDRGAMLGEGLFETVLLLSGVPQHLDAHLERMRASARALHLPVPGEGHGRVVAAGAAGDWQRLERPRRAVLRITLTAGRGRGLAPPGEGAPRVSQLVAPLPDHPDRSPLTLTAVRAHRVDPGAAVSGHKTLSWLPWIAARREAAGRGADAALVTTVDGDVCEADHANVFALVGGVVVTPSLDRGVLPGVTRARALAALRSAGHAVAERRLACDELRSASEAWLTSSLDWVRAIAAVDGGNRVAGGSLTAWLAACLDES